MAISERTSRSADQDALAGSIAPGIASTELVERLPALSAELLTIARFLVRGEAEAHDLVQTTLEVGIRHIDEVRDETRLRAWLVAIETREAMRVRRRVLRAFRASSRLPRPTFQSPPNDTALALRHAVEELPTRMRAAVVLHYMVGLSVEETAQAMSVSTNTARTHLKVGLRRLRGNLK